jgi:hypothetical protein
MNAYHVFLVNDDRPPGSFELLVQMYSCIVHKIYNSNTPLYLITDKKSKEFYDNWNITALYDKVITHYFDDYPYEMISNNFWASPKIWAMSKLKAPFVIYDTDLVLYKNLKKEMDDCDLLYLHRESPFTYGNPLDIEHSSSWRWDEKLKQLFIDSFPMNCAVVGMKNEKFKKEYVSKYFKFVLGASGEIKNMTDEKKKMYAASSAQITLEQWFLAALSKGVKNVKTKALVPVIYTNKSFYSFNLDGEPEEAQELLNKSIYHLWGAKKFENKPKSKMYIQSKKDIIAALPIITNSSYNDLLIGKANELISKLV